MRIGHARVSTADQNPDFRGRDSVTAPSRPINNSDEPR